MISWGVMHLRIISGKNRGLTLTAPDGLDTRPTLDRVREAVFNILFDRVVDANVLDLFSGSGAMGIEALSRYASSCVFVDKDKNAINCITKNVKKSRNQEFSTILYDDYSRFLKNYNGEGFDIIFLDPPYALWNDGKILSGILNSNIMKENCILIAECDRNHALNYDGFCLTTKKDYGGVSIYLLTKGE